VPLARPQRCARVDRPGRPARETSRMHGGQSISCALGGSPLPSHGLQPDRQAPPRRAFGRSRHRTPRGARRDPLGPGPRNALRRSRRSHRAPPARISSTPAGTAVGYRSQRRALHSLRRLPSRPIMPDHRFPGSGGAFRVRPLAGLKGLRVRPPPQRLGRELRAFAPARAVNGG
jgi:hypothetical protein